jgi:hypothetical protein
MDLRMVVDPAQTRTELAVDDDLAYVGFIIK